MTDDDISSLEFYYIKNDYSQFIINKYVLNTRKSNQLNQIQHSIKICVNLPN